MTGNRGRNSKVRALVYRMPMMMGCNKLELKIDDYLDDKLSLKERFVFELHLKICADCQKYLAGYKKTIDVTGALFHAPYSALGMGEISETLVERILKDYKGTRG